MKRILSLLAFITIIITISSCNFSKIKKLKQKLIPSIEKKLSKQYISTWALENNFTLVYKKRVTEILSKEGELLGTILESKNKRIINSFPLLGKKIVNPLLDKKLFPNTSYKIGQSIYITDSQSRVITAEIKSIPRSIVKRNNIRGARENHKAMLKDGIKGKDHGGHIIAHSLGGNSGAINIVAQYGKLNQGNYSKIERFISKNKRYIKDYKIKLTYKKNSQRPLNFVQTFNFRGSKRKLDKITKKNLNFKYVKENSSTYKCIVFHSNKL